jgi:hypothetical protein
LPNQNFRFTLLLFFPFLRLEAKDAAPLFSYKGKAANGKKNLENT